MNILAELKVRFAKALRAAAAGGNALLEEEIATAVELVRQSQDPKFGDYQANFAMPLAKRLGAAPLEIAKRVVEGLDLSDGLGNAEAVPPGFINVRLSDAWLAGAVTNLVTDERLGIENASSPRRIIIDYSAPNVAKPMHVGHIRSTVIGASLYRVLKFLGHDVISDNHLGDWGTQFGMIIYGYKHFRDEAAYAESAVTELGRLYRLVHQLVGYHENKAALAEIETKLAGLEAAQQKVAEAPAAASKEDQKKIAKEAGKLKQAIANARATREELTQKIANCDNDPTVRSLLRQYPHIASDVLAETAKLHEGDAENLRLWREFMGPCLSAIETIYQRLGVAFDESLGESYYHEQLATVVEELQAAGLATESDGAICVFFPGEDAPMIVRKRDGAFLYATTDLATIRYRVERWNPDAILYVVDHRQGQHFQQLFNAARKWRYSNVELQHVSFGTVLGNDGRPFKTRSGETVDLQGLIDEAVRRAEEVILTNARADEALATDEAARKQVAEIVGIGALKYADLSQNRSTDYVFSYDKMLAMNGNTATYMQYAYARVRSIFRKGEVDIEKLRASGAKISLNAPAERALALSLLQFSESLDMAVSDYRPHHLTNYLFELGNRYSTFFDQCPVLKAAGGERESRLLLCDLTARALKLGLELLGIDVVERM